MASSGVVWLQTLEQGCPRYFWGGEKCRFSKHKFALRLIVSLLDNPKRVIMRNDWIIDVLSDLRTFAVANGMGHLADQLDSTRLVAMMELASIAREAPVSGGSDGIRCGADFSRARAV